MTPVFIGVPTFNRPHLVVKSIESLRRQTFTEFRVIVSDNCSDPGVADRVKAYIAELADSRFSFYQQLENHGEYGQGRYFISAAQEFEFFMILHDDDILEPEFLRVSVDTLRRQADCSMFVANPYIIDREGARSVHLTADFLRRHGRKRMREGPFDILSSHLTCGFAPISGVLFRRSVLERSGFADREARGTYPFECDVFLRLGDIGAKGWFSPRELLALRFHEQSLRSNLRLIENCQVVQAMLALFAQRRFSGAAERRRKVLMSRLHRADALLRLRDGDISACRAGLRRARRENPRSPKVWAMSLAAWSCPPLLRALLRRLPSGLDVSGRYRRTADPDMAATPIASQAR